MSTKKSTKVKMKAIHTFFPSIKNNTSESSNEFYQEFLPKISTDNEKPVMSIEQLDTAEDLDNEIKQLKEKIEKLSAENAQLKQENTKYKNDFAGLMKVHKEMCRMYVNKDLKIKLMEKKGKSQAGVLFDSFKDDLGENVLKTLRRLHGSKRSDSTFILQCIRKLYATDDITSVSACGSDQNTRIPSEKREILEQIFVERLSSENLTDVETSERFLRLNRHINVAISNMRKEVLSAVSLRF